MADLAAQREARRKKLALNAEARMKKLLGNANQSGINSTGQDESLKERVEITNGDNLLISESPANKENQPAYNLRHRGTDSTEERKPKETLTETSPSPKETSRVPYEVVEDPEVPDLAEFLASQKAAKASKPNVLPPKRLNSDKGRLTVTQVEAIKVTGCIVSALLSELSLKYGFILLFQSIFIPFILFESIAVSIIYVYFQHISEPTGSLMVPALALCGIRAELVSTYLRIMNHVTLITSDFFTYVFVFIIIHTFVG